MSKHSRARALVMLDSCGVNNPERVLDELAHGEPDLAVATCERWQQRLGAGPGLLIRMLIDGDVRGADPVAEAARPKRAEMHERFADLAQRFPVGAVTETHQQMAARCWPKDDEQCAGRMIVLDALYPTIAVRCDGCGFEASYPLRAALEVLPSSPAAVGVSEPPLPEPGPMTVPPPAAFGERDQRAKELAGQILRDAGVRPARTPTEAT